MNGVTASTAEPLWRPKNVEKTRMHKFRQQVNQNRKLNLETYDDLWQWSVDHPDQFWYDCWHDVGVVHEGSPEKVVDLAAPIQTIPAWFPSVRLNWAENMLQLRNSEKTALIQFTEPVKRGGAINYVRTSYAQLYRLVWQAAASLKGLGIGPGDRVAWFGPNCAEAVVACLATTSIGAIWSSAAADFGPDGVLDRFVQIRPKVLISVNAVRYNEKVHSHARKLALVVAGLTAPSCSPNLILVNVPYVDPADVPDVGVPLPTGYSWSKFLSLGDQSEVPEGQEVIDFHRAGFDYPLWILFSSGTTGKPKAIVHRAGGMLLQSKKEHLLHGDMGPDDVFFYYTTPGWMMWNYLISSLSFGCTLVLFDGSPLHDPALLWRMVDDLGVTVFGTSAKYLDVLAKCYKPAEHHRLDRLGQVLSTGSPLKPELYDWAYANIKSDMLLGSITGGTDICSLFCGHNASLPVYRGEVQCRNLGMSLECWSDTGKPVPHHATGDLVCTKVFPCMPISFWEDEGHKRYLSSYMAEFPGVWFHGDFCTFTPMGGVIMLGRSDGILNPSGVRFGSSEIYDCLEGLDAVEDSLVVGQTIKDDERVVLFVQLRPPAQLDDALVSIIKKRIREKRSPRHVPECILQVNDIPHTANNKKVEVPVKRIINGAPLSSINLATLRNPKSLQGVFCLGGEIKAVTY